MKLPLEYSKLSKFFDALGSGSPDSVNRVIGNILKKHKVKSVLDMTCGTGSQVIWLAKNGYNVTGSDFSPKLLTIAKAKIKKANIKTKLLHGDMRNIKVGQFDAVITIFNAVGHLTKSGFEKAMRNIHKNLNKGGVYIFDIFNYNSLNNKDLSGLDMDTTVIADGAKIHAFQYSELDKKKGHLVSYDHYEIENKSGKTKNIKVRFALQIYTAKQLREMLVKNGFKVLGQYDLDGSKFSDKKTKEMLTVAMKV
jgi:2-polyprenyl-3-methyl-5-hydroxy-6-metoxy-1,4-benzoquinol methylase